MEATPYDCGISLLHPHLPNYHMSGTVPQRTGNAHPNIAPYDLFRTRDMPIFLAVGNDRQFATLCRVINRAALAQDPRFLTIKARNVNRDALKVELEAAFGAFACGSLAQNLITSGVPCGAVRTVDQIVADSHTIDRGTGSPIKLSRMPASYRLPSPKFGEHTDAIRAEHEASEEVAQP